MGWEKVCDRFLNEVPNECRKSRKIVRVTGWSCHELTLYTIFFQKFRVSGPKYTETVSLLPLELDQWIRETQSQRGRHFTFVWSSFPSDDEFVNYSLKNYKFSFWRGFNFRHNPFFRHRLPNVPYGFFIEHSLMFMQIKFLNWTGIIYFGLKKEILCDNYDWLSPIGLLEIVWY